MTVYSQTTEGLLSAYLTAQLALTVTPTRWGSTSKGNLKGTWRGATKVFAKWQWKLQTDRYLSFSESTMVIPGRLCKRIDPYQHGYFLSDGRYCSTFTLGATVKSFAREFSVVKLLADRSGALCCRPRSHDNLEFAMADSRLITI